jgi:transcriptional antiterminator NusG
MAKRWYSVSVLSNFEKRVAEQIRTAVAENGLEDVIEEVLVPEEDVIEIRRGKKVTFRAASCRATCWCAWR